VMLATTFSFGRQSCKAREMVVERRHGPQGLSETVAVPRSKPVRSIPLTQPAAGLLECGDSSPLFGGAPKSGDESPHSKTAGALFLWTGLGERLFSCNPPAAPQQFTHTH